MIVEHVMWSHAGAVLTEVPKRIFPKFSDTKMYDRLPPILLTSEELRSIRITQAPGKERYLRRQYLAATQEPM